jgi:outer membrane murein-binding lipoprotein Lpp
VSGSNTDNKVQLGCGTLIIIALIVMFFSGGRESKELRKSVDELNAKVDRLEQKIDELSKQVAERQPAPPPAEEKK